MWHENAGSRVIIAVCVGVACVVMGMALAVAADNVLSIPQAVLGSSTPTKTLLPDGRTLRVGASASGRPIATIAVPGGRAHALAASSEIARSNHTATVLPDGRVLIWGGLDAHFQIVDEGEWFSPIADTFARAPDIALLPRAGHSATLLTDGRLLITGGWNPQLGPLTEAELWDYRTNTSELLSTNLVPPRMGHSATLLPDGRVLIIGGYDAAGNRFVDAALYDPERVAFIATDIASLRYAETMPGSLALAASIPEQGVADFPPNGLLALRFTQPMDVTTLSTATVTLIGIEGGVSVRVVPAEGGRLLFVQPVNDLNPMSRYTLFVDGARAREGGVRLPFTAIAFQTAAFTVPTAKIIANGAGTPANKAAGDNESTNRSSSDATRDASRDETARAEVALTGTGVVHLTSGANATELRPGCQASAPITSFCRPLAVVENGYWFPGQNSISGHWRINGIMPPKPDSRLLDTRRIPSGATGFYGRVLRLDDTPVAGVTVSIGPATSKTDSQGVFVVLNAPIGHQTMVVDGSTANSPNFEYGDFVVGVDITSGQMTVFPDNLYLPRIHAQDKVTLSSPTTHETVITHPEMPGMEIHIPAGTVIRDRSGHLVTQLAIVPMPVDRAPFPVPINFPMYFMFEPGGAVLQGLTVAGATQGVSVVYPNMTSAPPNSLARFFVYDTNAGWTLYGTGHVSSDARSIPPDAGVGLQQVMGASYGISATPLPPLNAPPPCDDSICCPRPSGFGSGTGSGGGPSPPSLGPGGGGHGPVCLGGDPVDLSTGLFLHAGTDLSIRDVLPISIQRVYRTNDSVSRAFGVGGSYNYGFYLYNPAGPGNEEDFTNFDLVLPNGALVPYTLISGTMGQPEAIWAPVGPVGEWQGSMVQFRSTDFSAPFASFVVTRKDGYQLIFGAFYSFLNPLFAIRDRFGNMARFSNTAGLLTSVTSPSGRKITITLSASSPTNRITQIGDSMGRTVQYTYVQNGMNGAGSLQQVQYADGTVEQYGYDTNGRLRTVVDPRMNTVTTNSYDANGRVYQQTLADGTSSYFFTYVLDGNGHVTQTTVTDPNNHQRVVAFDNRGYVLTDINGYGTSIAQTRSYLRDANALVTDETDALSRTTHYTYDAEANITSITKLYGTSNAVTYQLTYTPDFNQIASVMDPLGHTTQFGYTNGCLTSIKDALLHTTLRSCNAAGQLASVTDALGQGHTTQYGYSGYDLQTTTDALNRTSTYEVDAAGRVTSFQDPAGERTRWTYDVRDRVATSTDALGQTTQYGYDNNDNLTSITDPKLGLTQFGYDVFNRKISRTDALHNQETWSYDAIGNLLTHTDRKSQTTRFNVVPYDALSRLKQVNYADGTTTALTWDAGNRAWTIADSVSGSIVRTFDGLDRLMSEQTPQGTVGYTYDLASRRQTMTPAAQGQAAQAQITYTFDDANRFHQMVQGTETVTINYDNANRRQILTLPNGMTVNYGFDNANELTGLTYKTSGGSTVGTLVYGYDAAGRRTSQTGTWSSDLLPTSTTTDGVFNAENQQTAFNGNTLIYDLNGNLTSDATYTYMWDARDRLTTIKQGVTTIASFAYDAIGRRTSKTIPGQTGAISLLYDGLNVVQEVQGGATRPILAGLLIDERFARTEAAGRRYFLTDALGSTLALADSTQTIQQTYRYEPYGEVSATGASDNPYQYTGRENDSNNIYYYRARYYNSRQKHFISEDPLSAEPNGIHAAGPNFYNYVGSSPVDFSDPTGLCVPCVLIAVCGENPACVGAVISAVGAAVSLVKACLNQDCLKQWEEDTQWCDRNYTGTLNRTCHSWAQEELYRCRDGFPRQPFRY